MQWNFYYFSSFQYELEVALITIAIIKGKISSALQYLNSVEKKRKPASY